jgi:hypothetical protein
VIIGELVGDGFGVEVEVGKGEDSKVPTFGVGFGVWGLNFNLFFN